MTAQAGLFYRIVFSDSLADVLNPVRNPEGRFHNDGEPALYTSCTPEGARQALGYYARADDPPRSNVELEVTGAKLFDMRDRTARDALSLKYADASVRWQDERAAGLPATTWRISNAVRESGADGMYYPSSTKPDVFHMVLFRWNSFGGAEVRINGKPVPCEQA
jgi:RES domain-containing protein